jgi:ankyrin repeat protein
MLQLQGLICFFRSFSPFGYTPLQWAAGQGRLDVVRLLLAARADVQKTDK